MASATQTVQWETGIGERRSREGPVLKFTRVETLSLEKNPQECVEVLV